MQASESFPTIAQAAFLLLVSFLLRYLIGAAFYDFRHVLQLSASELDAMTFLIADGILIATVIHFQKSSHRHLVHASQSSWMTVFILIVPPVMMTVPLIFMLDHVLIETLEFIWPISIWEEQAFARMVSSNLGAIVATCFLAPVLEEMLFRGIFLRSFLDQYPKWLAISASALLFGAAHLNVYQFALAGLLGLFLGWLYERTRSLIPCIALHGALNTLVVATAGDQYSSSDFAVAWWLLAIILALAGVHVLRRLLLIER